MGGQGVLLLVDGHRPTLLPPVPVTEVVDQTGAGDALAGTAAARLALGDPVEEAVRLGTAAAALSLAGAGGTGRVPTLAQTRAALAAI
jgi:2-dehydro-3-deoxygluconokinase